MKTVCDIFNPECIIISCCSEPCDSLHRFHWDKYPTGIMLQDMYDLYLKHILEHWNCPICNRTKIQFQARLDIQVRCNFCDKVFEFHLDHNNDYFLNRTYDSENLVKSKVVSWKHLMYIKFKDLNDNSQEGM